MQYRYPQSGPEPAGMYEFISTNGGATFGAGRRVGTIPFFEAVNGPGATLSGVTDANSGGGLFQNVPLDGAARRQPARPSCLVRITPTAAPSASSVRRRR